MEALEALLEQPGWAAFREYVAREWGPTPYAQKLKAAVQHARTVGTDAGHAIELVDAANDAVRDMMRWPSDEVARLRRQAQTPEATMSRRGGL